MNSESKLVIELWDFFRDMITAGKRQDAATHLLRLFQEYNIEFEQSDIEGECEYLDEAISILLEDDQTEEFDDEEEY